MNSVDFPTAEDLSHMHVLAKKILFLVWAPHSMRAVGISTRLGGKVHMLNYGFRRKIYSPIKYSLLFYNSLVLLRKERPDIVIAQLPPVFCGLAAVTYKMLYNKQARVVLDLHTASLYSPWSYLRPLTQAIMKKTALAIVTNIEARDNVLNTYGREPIVLEDRIPDFTPNPPVMEGAMGTVDVNEGHFAIVIPSSFAPDEPVEEILKAAADLPDITFYITGDEKFRTSRDAKIKFKNVIFTGFLDKEEYNKLLMNANAIMALTTRDKTLLAGAYEALACEKPLITSEWAPLRRYFSKGTVFVDNSSPQIRSAIQIVRRTQQDLVREMRLLKVQKVNEWQKAFEQLAKILELPLQKIMP